ncbi:hypothetical protein BH11GEM2_BH11GEM2_14190 [soil metagenome]|jgi:hypothetical protein
MDTKQTEQLMAMAQQSPEFLGQLLSNPTATAATKGITLTEEEAATLSALSADEFQAFADDYKNATDPAKRRAAC